MKLFEKQLVDAAQTAIDNRKAKQDEPGDPAAAPPVPIVRPIRRPEFFRGARVKRK